MDDDTCWIQVIEEVIWSSGERREGWPREWRGETVLVNPREWWGERERRELDDSGKGSWWRNEHRR